MPEQPAELQRINWSACFPFTLLFRTFKMALHPSKLGLALAALILLGALGYGLDYLWRLTGRSLPVTDEVHAFWQTPDLNNWRARVLAERPEVVKGIYSREGLNLPQEIAKDLESQNRAGAAVRRALKDFRRQGWAKLYESELKPEDRAALAARLNEEYRTMDDLRPRGVFASFLGYEVSAIRRFIESVATLNLTGQLGNVLTARRESGAPADWETVRIENTNVGALGSLFLMARGVQWLIWEHPWYALLFGLGKLAIFAFFGGAISRMAAMNFARDERIPFRSALGFARRKFVSFLTAPLLPIGLILAAGLFLFLGGLIIGSIPYIGGFLAGLGMIFALLAGAVMALVLIGLLAGGSLMWPTIAVEGSDSFDAMSRSYSYVFSRPWKAAFYALVASIYGAITYLFLWFFVWLLFRLARFFVGLGMIWTDRPGTGSPDGTRIDVLWPMPGFDTFMRAPPAFGPLYWDDTWGYGLTMFWVGLTVLLLCSFLVSFYLCASTIIYYLLRRDVDATDLEDVYSEEGPEEELVPGTTTAPEAAPAPAAASPEAGEPPARA